MKNDKRKIESQILEAQRLELTEHLIYKNLIDVVKREDDRKVLKKIADEEYQHFLFWAGKSGEEVSPYRLKVFFYTWMSRIFGLNFGLRLMEKEEAGAQEDFDVLKTLDPEVEKIIQQEVEHEEQLLALMSQEELKYTGSVILGLNDALVELTGVLAGLTFALQQGKIVAIAGFITGIAASLSMAGSEYLSTKEENLKDKSPIKASFYTGIAYIIVVIILIFPYFLVEKIFISLGISLASALFIIFIFNYYISVAKNLPFKKKFLEMASISLGVAVLNFVIGLLIRNYLHIDI
ncbi:VIT1/CCC1 transporter family protein [Candidatus Peregrinibacteria bacterium]|nr:VIT1/CCC1 transporter family protein [Candidatus Peregrinibacteria bacterium]